MAHIAGNTPQYVLLGIQAVLPVAYQALPAFHLRHVPRDANDVLETERALSTPLPSTAVWDILELAQYWPRSVGEGGELTVSASDASVRESVCCTVTIPPFIKKGEHLRQIVITIESHDQGAYYFTTGRLVC